MINKTHKKEYGVYHWDTFDNETFLQHECDDLDEAIDWTKKHYGTRLKPSGADQVEIVDSKGDIRQRWSVG